MNIPEQHKAQQNYIAVTTPALPFPAMWSLLETKQLLNDSESMNKTFSVRGQHAKQDHDKISVSEMALV